MIYSCRPYRILFEPITVALKMKNIDFKYNELEVKSLASKAIFADESEIL